MHFILEFLIVPTVTFFFFFFPLLRFSFRLFWGGMSEAFHGNSGVVMIIAKARRKGHGVFWGLSIMVFA